MNADRLCDLEDDVAELREVETAIVAVPDDDFDAGVSGPRHAGATREPAVVADDGDVQVELGRELNRAVDHEMMHGGAGGLPLVDDMHRR